MNKSSFLFRFTQPIRTKSSSLGPDVRAKCMFTCWTKLTQLAVADSKEKREKFRARAFSGDPAMWSCVLANDVPALLNDGSNFCRLSLNHSNILDVTRPRTKSDRMWISLGAGQVLFDKVYLLVEWTCASTNKSFKRKETCSACTRCVELHRTVVNRVCTRQSTGHGQWLCNEKAIAVLAQRRSEVLER